MDRTNKKDLEAENVVVSTEGGIVNSAAKPAQAMQQKHSSTLQELQQSLECRANEINVSKWLKDVSTFQAWKREQHPSHEVRDAMTNLASKYYTTQKQNAKKRKPDEVARDLERELKITAKRLLEKETPFTKTSNAAKSSSQG